MVEEVENEVKERMEAEGEVIEVVEVEEEAQEEEIVKVSMEDEVEVELKVDWVEDVSKSFSWSQLSSAHSPRNQTVRPSNRLQPCHFGEFVRCLAVSAARSNFPAG